MPLFRRDRPGRPSATGAATVPAPPAAGPALDPAAGDPDGRRLWQHLGEGDWAAVEGILSPAGPLDREFLVDVAAALPGRPEWLDTWVDARPGEALPLLVRGAQGVRWAWAARGRAMADQVDQRAWDVFFGRLNAAERDLLEAARLAPEDPVPWTDLIVSGRGLEISLEEICLRFDQATARERWLPYAHDQMLQALCAKWFGSSDLMFHFASDTTAEAPEGSSVHKVVALAHLEEWLYGGHPAGYFRDPSVVEDLVAAADRSVFSPLFGREKQAPYARHAFALVFHLAGDRERAGRLFAEIGNVVVEFPWSYLGDPVEAFGRARAATAG